MDLKTVEKLECYSELDDRTTIKLLGSGRTNIYDRNFKFIQMHFHVESEHLIDDAATPMEIHLVHQNMIGQICVIALMVNIGASDSNLQSIINHYSKRHSIPMKLCISDWLPEKAIGFHYLGSLTTPPLSEGVEWVVIQNPEITVSEQQLHWFKTNFQRNQRQVQKVNERHIEYCSKNIL